MNGRLSHTTTTETSGNFLEIYLCRKFSVIKYTQREWTYFKTITWLFVLQSNLKLSVGRQTSRNHTRNPICSYTVYCSIFWDRKSTLESWGFAAHVTTTLYVYCLSKSTYFNSNTTKENRASDQRSRLRQGSSDPSVDLLRDVLTHYEVVKRNWMRLARDRRIWSECGPR